MRILKLGRCDVVLGVDWLRVYSQILFDFIKIKISFKKNERMIKLKGIVDGAGIQIMASKKVLKSLKEAVMGFVGYFFGSNVRNFTDKK